MNSCLYVGQVRHRRFEPREHAFSYRLFYLCIDLDEIDHVFDGYFLWSANRPNIASFDKNDHLKAFSKSREYSPDIALVDRVRDYLELETGSYPKGPIYLLTHLSYFGFRFNPVSFYYCYSADGLTIEHIIAEVNNTPWGEQYCYLISNNDSDEVKRTQRKNIGMIRHETSKRFHVSPFMPMDIDYDWRFSTPQEHLSVHMQNYRNGHKMFDATLTLEREAISSRALSAALIRFPLLTLKIVFLIYFEAMRLMIKRIPFFNHPDNEAPDSVKVK